MPYHVMIWPQSPRQQTLRELYGFNLDENTLQARFIDPYERAEPITWHGRTLEGGDVATLQVTETDAPYDEQSVRRNHQEYEFFKAGRDVTNDWIVRPAGSLAGSEGLVGPELKDLDWVEHLCRRFDIVARQLRRRHGGRPTLAIDDEYDAQDLLHALLLKRFDDVRSESWNPN